MSTHQELNAQLDQLSDTALKMKAERDWLQKRVAALEGTLAEVRDLLDGYVDVTDGDYGQPEGNKAMKAQQRIDEVLP